MAYEDSQNVQRQEHSPSRSQEKRLAVQGKPPESSIELAERILSLCDSTGELDLAAAERLIDAYVLERELAVIEEALTAAKRGFNSKSKKSRKAGVYERICDLATARASQPSPREKP